MDELTLLDKVDHFNFPGIGELKSQKIFPEIYKTKDSRAYFIRNEKKVLVYLPTSIGVPAYYELVPVKMPAKIKAVLMDLDGTTVKSEEFWIWVVEEVVRQITKKRDFKFTPEDIPHVSGFSVSEHLSYAINKYLNKNPEATLSKAQKLYFEIVHRELSNIAEGKSSQSNHTFKPSDYLKEFLLALKEKGIKIGLVSSGLHEKAWPEIISAFKTLSLGNPLEFYDTIVTAGTAIKKGQAGTLGELEPKPHPWLYAETLHALHIKAEETIVIEDSGAGVVSARTAKLPVIGVAEIGRASCRERVFGFV
jgi:beta-phosphoglucomutase